MYSLPYQVDLGVNTVHGVLRLEQDGVSIEWRVFDIFEAPKGDLESITIPYGRLRSVECTGRLGAVRIVITADSPSWFQSYPLQSGSITTLRATVKRRYRSDARSWAAEAALRIAESDDSLRIE